MMIRRQTDDYELIGLKGEKNSQIDKQTGSDDGIELPSRSKESWRTFFSGWRGGVVASLLLSILVLIFNVTLVILASTQWYNVDNIATIYQGACGVAGRATTAAHLVINLLSSLLFGASHYCMQRLAAPTRKEVDRAHAKRKWLDIGMPSVRNLPSISKRRSIPWLLLALSSIPLHFVYNSVVFETIGANNVVVLGVTEKFLTVPQNPGPDGYNQPNNGTALSYVDELQNKLLNGNHLDPTLFDNLTMAECESRYSAPFISYGSAVGVLTAAEFWEPLNNTILKVDEGFGLLQLDMVFSFESPSPAYCLSEKVVQPPGCSVQISLTILYVVIACNIVKIGVMVFILLRLSHETTLVTIGDAINSFLQSPDSTTANRCLMSKKTVNQLWENPGDIQHGQEFNRKPMRRWGIACSGRRWLIAITLYLGAIITVSSFLNTVEGEDTPFDGFGKVTPSSVVTLHLPAWAQFTPIPYILIANSPQAIVSFMYLVYNGNFTAMLGHREWSNYAVKRTPLRVTNPSPRQRSTHYLQIPYVFGVPLLVAAVVLHWLISQSIFLIRAEIHEEYRLNATEINQFPAHEVSKMSNEGSISALGYSGIALATSLSWGIMMVVVILAVALFCKYPDGLPIGGLNSAVISAACHPRHNQEDREGVSDGPMKWGVVIPGSEETVGHLAFSNEEVQFPEEDHLYAGLDGMTPFLPMEDRN